MRQLLQKRYTDEKRGSMRGKTPEILYEDEAVLVCRKEAGVAVQTARSAQQDMVSLLKNYRAAKKETPYIGVIHRLDQPVEGVMVFAKTPQAAAKLSAQVSGRSVEKEYLAVTAGVPQPESGKLRDFLRRDGRTNTSSVVAEGTPDAKEARLSYRVEQTSADGARALVLVRLETGRHHQIRVQMAHAGYPLEGDRKYGKERVPWGNSREEDQNSKKEQSPSVIPTAQDQKYGRGQSSGGNPPEKDGKGKFIDENLSEGYRAHRKIADAFCPLALCSVHIGFAHPITKQKMQFDITPKGAGFAEFF